MSFKYFLYLDCFSGQILTGCQRIHITDILSRIRQGICRSRIADAKAVHRLYQLISIADIKRGTVMELYGFDFGTVITEMVIYLDSLNFIAIDGDFQVVAYFLKRQVTLADTFTKDNLIIASGFSDGIEAIT